MLTVAEFPWAGTGAVGWDWHGEGEEGIPPLDAGAPPPAGGAGCSSTAAAVAAVGICSPARSVSITEVVAVASGTSAAARGRE